MPTTHSQNVIGLQDMCNMLVNFSFNVIYIFKNFTKIQQKQNKVHTSNVLNPICI
jgi:hypothetical protein